MGAHDLLLVAGEASGDLHGARLLSELKSLVPDLEAFGMGGAELRAAGLDAVADSREIAVVGLTEALRILPRAKQIFRQLLAECERRKPATAILIDSPEFNLRLAKQLKARGIKVIYYISPQVWAWRRGRVKAIARVVDLMLVVFPFEVDFYRGHDVAVEHVGHPLVDEVPVLPQAWDRGAPAGGEPFRITLLPGSRRSEVEALLPSMLGAARLLVDRLPAIFTLVQAPTIADEQVENALATAGVEVRRIRERRFEEIANSHLVLCASGTATLEVGLLGTPLIVAYRLNPLTYRMAKWLVRLPHFSLVNLVLGRGVVPELLQEGANAEGLAAAAEGLLRDPARIAVMRTGLAELRPRLGASGASRRAAEQVAGVLLRNGRAA
ncbi:MAG: lipid-A-disaccharide synthase [Acidobacteriota bacterium]